VTVGLRGVGKTVVLNKVQQLAEDQGYQAAYIEAHDDIQLTSVLATALRPVLLKLDRMASANDVVQRGLRTLRSFASTFRVSYGGIDLGIDPEAGSADSGDLQSDLPDLFLAIGNAAKARKTAVALIIDEVQYVNEKELSALIMSIHRVNQRELPLIFFGAGLPQLRGKMGEAKSYVERLLDFPLLPR
jgi:Cdc6-like AAA superfamily ATPase